MLPGIRQIVVSSVRFYKRAALYQFLIIGLLSAIITGSLLTGYSIKANLKKTAVQRLGNTGILVSSGTRYFDMALAKRLKDNEEVNCTGLLEINGYCQNLTTQKEAVNTHIYAVSEDFFLFNGNDTTKIAAGEAAVNERIADFLDLKKGDEIIIRFSGISDVPPDAPFAPEKEGGSSVVLKVGTILGSENAGNFSLSISQVIPQNIFINITDIHSANGKNSEINRLLLAYNDKLNTNQVYSLLTKNLELADIGLRIVPLVKSGGFELRSDRIFIDSALIHEVQQFLPEAAPVITYLGNRFSFRNRFTPYSFVAALPRSLYPEIETGNSIKINRWMAEDLAITRGDTLQMTWYSPDSLNRLVEKKRSFPVSGIVEMKGIWGDSLLMPDFPGISGRESCSSWDAGVPVNMSVIRTKDEDYWKKYKGTPKAFLNYKTGSELWGNNFGPATAIRFPASRTEEEITHKLSGKIDPEKNGFSIIDLYDESISAADESVDFSSLFLSLGFFLILASLVLLSFAVTSYLDSKHNQIRTFFSLGFRSSWIEKVLIWESGLISFIGCFFGSLAGILVNILIIRLLNTVWSGAVQTNTLRPFVSLIPVTTGLSATMATAVIFMVIKIKVHLKKLNRDKTKLHSPPSSHINLIFLLISIISSTGCFLLSIAIKDKEVMLCFVSGSMLLFFMILFWRQLLINSAVLTRDKRFYKKNLSKSYYFFNSSHATAPILFIATGIFAVFITGANRMNFDISHLKPSGGTGGFLLWCENSIPVREDLTTTIGKHSLGLDEKELSGLKFVQLKKYAGNDASCLNLNHIKMPPLLGLDASEFISRGAFSFAGSVKEGDVKNPWDFLNVPAKANTINGIADQTVLEWGLKIKTGDTLVMRSETGQRLNIRIAGALKSSVFQGYVLIGMENFRKYFPSASGSSVLLVDGNKDQVKLYIGTLKERLVNYGVSIEQANNRLASFYEVTNTYLMVFGAFGALGMIIGIAGLGFVLLRNFSYRRREFALLMATGFTIGKIRGVILYDHVLILLAGIASGFFPALVATFPSLKSSPDVPWVYLISVIIAIGITGTAAIFFSVGSITADSLTSIIRKE